MSQHPSASSSIFQGDAFSRLLHRLALVDAHGLPSGRAVAAALLLGWVVPGLLSWAQGVGPTAGQRGSFLWDFGSHARFLICLATFLRMEKVAQEHLTMLIHEFLGRGLIDAEQQPKFQAGLRRAEERCHSGSAAGLQLGLALVMSAAAVLAHLKLDHGSWMGSLAHGHFRLTLGGIWVLLVSFPLFWFLLWRWVWRLGAVVLMLREVSRLDLQLVPTHPDRCGGLSFLAQIPEGFRPLLFALSCLAAATVFEEMTFASVSLHSLGSLAACWLALAVVLFLGPLTLFSRALFRLREESLLEFGQLCCLQFRTLEQRWLGRAEMEPGEFTAWSHRGRLYQDIQSIHLVPGGKESLHQVAVVAALPWVAVAATRVPLPELLKTLAELLV